MRISMFGATMILTVTMAAGCGMAGKGSCPACTAAKGTAPSIAVDFAKSEVGKLPEGFTTALTHDGQPGQWIVLDDGGRKVLGQVSTDATKARYPLCIYTGATARDMSVTVNFKAVSGKVDQAAGLVARYKDKDNYYLARANALESNTRLYKVEAGNRILITDANMTVTPGTWHKLKLEIAGTHQKVYFDNRKVIEAEDSTFTGPGKAGLWTKADSVTYFDALTIEPLK